MIADAPKFVDWTVQFLPGGFHVLGPWQRIPFGGSRATVMVTYAEATCAEEAVETAQAWIIASQLTGKHDRVWWVDGPAPMDR